MLFASSCITEEPDFSTEVINVEDAVVSYYDIDLHHWYCREALIYVNSKPKYVVFPEQYGGEIVSGTRVEWHCATVTSYYSNGRKVTIDWTATRM